MVRIVFIANMMGCMDERMEGNRRKSYQQENGGKLEYLIFWKLNHNFSSS